MMTNEKQTTAAHVSLTTGKHRVDGVGIWNLRVVVYQEGPMWVAQGLEIDYVTQGSSVAEAKQCFQDGFLTTIREHLQEYQSIEKFLVAAPQDVQFEMDEKLERPILYSHVSLHVEALEKDTRINFLSEVPKEKAA